MNFDSKLNFVIKKDLAVNVGFYICAALTVLGMAFQLIRGFSGMENAWAISTGIEVLGLALNTAVFLGFLHNKETGTNVRAVFAALIVTSSLGLFWDEVAWLVQGLSEFSVANRVTNALLYVNSFTMELMFWNYIVYAFKIKTKVADFTTRFLIIFWFPMTISSLANIFIPVYFTVDSSGMYQRSFLYPLHLLYFLVVVFSEYYYYLNR